jgi:hypothetical protein
MASLSSALSSVLLLSILDLETSIVLLLLVISFCDVMLLFVLLLLLDYTFFDF